MKSDTKERYGTVSKVLHWGMAFFIGWQVLKFFDRINDGEHWVGQTLVPWHVSIGTLILVLVVLRIIWAVKQKGHRPAHDPATAMLVQAGHGLLYLGMVLMPITGILYLVGLGYGLNAFGVQLIAQGPEISWMISVGGLHSPIAWILLILILGHIGMALLHHFIKKDDTLRRML